MEMELIVIYKYNEKWKRINSRLSRKIDSSRAIYLGNRKKKISRYFAKHTRSQVRDISR